MTTKRFEKIDYLWNNNDLALVGVKGHYCQTIDHDQAVDEDGNANYETYRFESAVGTIATYTAAYVEQFAKTW